MAKLKVWKCFSVWMVLVLVVGLGAALVPASPVAAIGSTINVSQLTYLTTNSAYDRNPSIVYDGSEYWLFYTKGDDTSTSGVRGTYNPDADAYTVYYKKASTIAGLASATETKLVNSETKPPGFNQRDVSAVYFNSCIYAFVDGGQSGTDNHLYYFKYDYTDWSNRTPLTLASTGGHVNAVVDGTHVGLVWEAAGGKSEFYTFDDTTNDISGSKVDIDNGNQPKITKMGSNLYVVNIKDYAGSPINLWKSVDGGANWTDEGQVNGMSDFYDPVIFNDGTNLYVVSAPYNSGDDQQYLVQSKSADGGASWSTAKKVSNGGYGSTYWWDYWPIGYHDGTDAYLFFTTETNSPTFSDAEIAYVKMDWPLTNDHYFYIQNAINAANSDDTINVAAGTYDVATLITVNQAVTIMGPESGGAIVRGTTADDIRIFKIVTSDVTIKNLEITVASLGAYASEVSELDNSLVGISGSALSNVSIENNVLYVPLQSGPMSGWNARAITAGNSSSANIIISDNTIYNVRNGIVVRPGNTATVVNNIIFNTKGGIMNYTSNQSDANNRTVTGNSWASTVSGVISHNEWDIVWNTATYVPDYQQSVVGMSLSNNGAYVLDRRGAVPANLTGNRSHIFVDAASSFSTAYPWLGNFNEPFSSISLGVDAVVPGGTINVLAGTYDESVTINKNNLTLFGQVASQPAITGGLKLDTDLTGLTLQNFYVSGTAVPAKNSIVFMYGAITDLIIDKCVFDGENIAGRMGFTGGQIEGDLAVTNSEFKDILDWAVFDTRSGSGGDGSVMGTVTFANNNVHDCNGSIVFRGLSTDWTDNVYIYGNTFQDIGEAGVSDHWAAFEVNRANNVEIYDNEIRNVVECSWGEGQAMQLWQVGTVDIYANTVENNYMGIAFLKWPTDETYDVSGISIYDNNFFGNNQYALSVEDGLTGGLLNATNNWWGSANGPEHSGNTFNVGSQGDKVTDNVDYVPWLNAAYPGGTSFAPVNDITKDLKFSSIQAAINAASAGDTINVAAGTYNVANSWDDKCCIYINKDLTLSGAGSGSTILDAKHTYSCVNGPPCGPHCTVVWNEAPNVMIEGMTVKGGDYGIRNTNLYEHEVSLDTLVFEDVVVTDNRGHGFVFECDVNTVTMTYCAGNENGDRGIYFCPNKTATTVTLTNTSANDNKHIGFNCQGSITNLSISGGTFNNNAGGKTNYDCDTQEGPFYGFGMELVNCVGTIDGVTAQDNGQDAEAPAEKGAGINIKGASSDVNITYSTLAGNPIGLWLENWDGNQPSPAAVAINNSNVAGNADFGVNNGCTGVTVDATNNWWGANNGPGVVGPGSGDKVSANVDYDPWLRRGSDVTPATGIGAVTFEVDAGGITGLTAVAEGTLPTAGKPSGVAFLYGLFSFNIIGITPGSTVTVTITYFSATPVGTQYWKCQGDVWVNCTSLLGDDDGDNVLTLTLTDGGLGDADGLANGTIVDPGGPCVGGGGGFGGGGGGGGSPVAAVAYSATLTANMQGNIATVRMTEDGVLGEALVAKDAAGKYRLEIDKGAKVMLAGNVVPLLLRFRGASTTPPTPGNTVIVGPVYEFNAYASKSATTPSPITISPPARLILTYEPDELPQNASEVFIAYYDTEKGWLALAPVPGVVAEIDKAYGMVSHFTPFAVLARTTGPAPAKFRVGVLTVTPSQAKLNQEVNISVNVANTGGTSGSYSLELKVNGISESTKQVTVAAGASQTVDFTITEAQPGTYTVDIAGQKGTFVVMGASTTLNAGLLAIMIAAALILATVVVLLLAFRRRAQ